MFLSIERLLKRYGEELVVDGLSCELEAHQTLSILGRSGCGKTTLLKIIAGLEPADSGSIRLNGRDVTVEEPQTRGIVYLYQEPLLFPHLNVWDNVAFGLRLRKVGKPEIEERVGEMLDNIGLAAHAAKTPDQLSGGQRQRVAFGRAIIVNPRLLLLDEPFASLDVEIRASMQQLFKDLGRRFEITSIFVTHDLKEALLMGDHIAYMRDGRLKRYASRESFIRDPDVGVLDEIAFWSGLKGD
jgi:ABC-type sugar transport system ATPase subunit